MSTDHARLRLRQFRGFDDACDGRELRAIRIELVDDDSNADQDTSARFDQILRSDRLTPALDPVVYEQASIVGRDGLLLDSQDLPDASVVGLRDNLTLLAREQ